MFNKENSSLKNQIAWLFIAKIIGFGFTILLPFLIVRLLSQEKVGIYREAFQVIMNGTAVLSFGFSMSAYYFLGRETERRNAVIFNILLFNFIMGGLAYLTLSFYPQILGNLFQSGEMTFLAPKIGIIIWIWIFSTFLESVVLANQEARLATVFIIFSQFSKTFLMVLAVVLFTTIEAFLYAAMIQGVLQTLILLFYLNSRFRGFWSDFRPKFFAEHFIYALPFGLAAILWMLQTDAHNYFVAHKFGSAEFAIYAYGCFQLPLIGMLAESVSSVMIPRMSELQAKNDTQEVIRLAARAMQKLALVYFPIYIFLMITAETFIITLFTKDYLASVPIFIINLTVLPFGILFTDPIVRAYKEFARILLVLRVFIVTALLAVLYFGLDYLEMQGIIIVAVISLLVEKFIAEIFILRRLGVSRKDIYLLKDVGKAAIVSLSAGIITFVFYVLTKDYLFNFGEKLAADIFQTSKISILNLFGGSLTLFITGLVFAPLYLLGAYYSGIIEDQEIQQFKTALNKVRSVFKKNTVQKTQSQIQN